MRSLNNSSSNPNFLSTFSNLTFPAMNSKPRHLFASISTTGGTNTLLSLKSGLEAGMALKMA